VPVLVCEPSILEEMTGIAFHRGCLALAHRIDSTLTIEDLSRVTRILAIEGVANPDNVGGLFRSALALGAGAIVLDRTAADPLYRKAIRTSMGAALRLPYLRVDGWANLFAGLRPHGFRVIALAPHAEAVPLDEVAVERDARLVLAVGSEGAGLGGAVLEAADIRVRISIDSRADSLNVVVAASIALHALRDR
jgi:tRNA G18 (ribose-2'-O)-methylase SpoU